MVKIRIYWRVFLNGLISENEKNAILSFSIKMYLFGCTNYHLCEPSQTICTVDINELDNNAALELIPNLITSGATIQIRLKETTAIENYQLSIYDIGGQLISSIPLQNNWTFEAPKEKGFYIVQLLKEKRIEGIGKLVVVE